MASDAPLFPEAFGTILGELLNPTPPSEQSGPPRTHTLSQKPPCDLDDCCAQYGEPCDCNCHKPQPTHTITRVDASECVPVGEAMRRALMAEDQILLYGRSGGRSKALADAMASLHEAWHPTPPIVPGWSRETTDAVMCAAAEAGVRPGGFENEATPGP